MSDKYKRLVSAIRAVAPKAETIPLFTAEVKKITGDTCTILYGDLELTEVRLKVTIDDDTNTMMFIPKVGTMVLVGSLTGDLKDLSVVKVDVLDKIILDVKVEVDLKSPKVKVASDDIQVKGGKVAIDADSIVMNGGNNMGLAKVQSIADRLNLIEQDLTTVKAVFTAWIPAGSLGDASALKGAITSWAAAPLATTTAAQLENKDIKH